MKTLVLIDSDALTRALISQCLAGQEWRVFEAEDGQAGLELILEHKPAAVVCDLRTPKRNGFQVCRWIREQPSLQPTRVILITVSRFANDRETAFAAGADDYLVKPIAPPELIRTMAACKDNGEAVVEEAPAKASSPGRPWSGSGAFAVPFRRRARTLRSTAETPRASRFASATRSSSWTPAPAFAGWGKPS